MNAIHGYYRNYLIYAGLFVLIGITSILYRYHNNVYTYILDQIAIYIIVLYGGFMLYKNSDSITSNYLAIIICTFLAVIYLYYYGWCVDNFCFHPDHCIANNYHGCLHFISSFGHHLIMAI
jgi:hypothetical protein